MERRDFLSKMTAAGVLSMLDPAYLLAKEQLQSGKHFDAPVARRTYGRSDERLSIIGFGGIIVKDESPKEAARHVAEAVERGVNYFDVAPTYGNAQDRLGPALKKFRKDCFLACKTTERDAAGAERELNASLKTLQTDHFDLYQLHALSDVEEVERVFAPGGAMETFVRAREQGKVRYLGFSAHSDAAALAALDRFDFDSILFPLSFPTWIKGEFGPSVHKRAVAANQGILALKSMAHQKWPATAGKQRRRWGKAWYQPFDQLDQAALGLRFTLHLPATAMIPPGEWPLFKIALDLAQSDALTPLNEQERLLVAEIAQASTPIFTTA